MHYKKSEYLARVLSSLLLHPNPSPAHTNRATRFTPATVQLHVPYGAGRTLPQRSLAHRWICKHLLPPGNEGVQPSVTQSQQETRGCPLSSARHPHILPEGRSEPRASLKMSTLAPAALSGGRSVTVPFFVDGYETKEVKLLAQHHRTNLHGTKTPREILCSPTGVLLLVFIYGSFPGLKFGPGSSG